jgi:glucose-6-phosphate isomerase
MKKPTQTAGSTAQAQLLTERPAWKALEAHCAPIRNLRQFFADDPRRSQYTTAMERT